MAKQSVSVFAILVVGRGRRRRIAIVDNVASDDGKPAGWGLPGGSVDEGEVPERALEREIREETSLDLTRLGIIISDRHLCFIENVRSRLEESSSHQIRTYVIEIDGLAEFYRLQPQAEDVRAAAWADDNEIRLRLFSQRFYRRHLANIKDFFRQG